jgi:hypothetical protein
VENAWLWTADHDLDDVNNNNTRISVYSGRGLSIESTVGNIWLVGTAVEHHDLYQYQLTGTKNIFIGFIQVSLCSLLSRVLASLPGQLLLHPQISRDSHANRLSRPRPPTTNPIQAPRPPSPRLLLGMIQISLRFVLERLRLAIWHGAYEF